MDVAMAVMVVSGFILVGSMVLDAMWNLSLAVGRRLGWVTRRRQWEDPVLFALSGLLSASGGCITYAAVAAYRGLRAAFRLYDAGSDYVAKILATAIMAVARYSRKAVVAATPSAKAAAKAVARIAALGWQDLVATFVVATRFVGETVRTVSHSSFQAAAWAARNADKKDGSRLLVCWGLLYLLGFGPVGSLLIAALAISLLVVNQHEDRAAAAVVKARAKAQAEYDEYEAECDEGHAWLAAEKAAAKSQAVPAASYSED